jgi:two-component system response regulator ResD
MARILIADDEARIRSVIKEYAEFEGHEVVEAEDGMQAVELCEAQDFDLIILDIMMPRLDGFLACKAIRKNSYIPVLMLSARGEEFDKLFGFELGIDDYVVKPFSPKELMARVKAILQRNGTPAYSSVAKKTFEGLEIDFKGKKVVVDGEAVTLTPKEYDLLFYMAQRENTALTRDNLLCGVWGYTFFGDYRTVDTHIKMLRAKLGPYRKFIITLRGTGYKFEA